MRLIRFLALLTLSLVVYAGCSSDDPIGPDATGTIVINPMPDVIDAPWTLAGPNDNGRNDNGGATLSDMAVGEYTLTWGDVSGWTTPTSPPQTLAADGTVTFSGTYIENSQASDRFVEIVPGTFAMGSPPDEPGRYDEREAQHTVTLTRGFYMSKSEVTEEWWNAVMGGGISTSQLPKNNVSWDDAVAFCNALSEAEGLTPVYTIHGVNGDVTWNQNANGYRLPTEAEWEYACRAESQDAFTNGPITELSCASDPNLDAVGWHCGNSGDDRHEVSLKQANAWGLYDMHGNLWEWCWDGYRSDYESLPQQDPVHEVGSDAYRVRRGGGWSTDARGCRSANRRFSNPDSSPSDLGIRPVRSVF